MLRIPGTRDRRSRWLLPVFASGVVAFLTSCGHGVSTGGKIKEVRYYHLTSSATPKTTDPMVRLVPSTLLHGASQPEDVIARFGNYYWVYWGVSDKSQPAKLKMEYRQTLDPTVTRSMEVEFDKPKRSNKTEFLVVGQPYLDKGRVYAWHLSLTQGGKELDTHESYLWRKSRREISSAIASGQLLDTSTAVMTLEDNRIITTSPPFKKEDKE